MNIAADFERDGFAVIRNAVPQPVAASWREAYDAHIATKGRAVGWNKVEVNGPFTGILATLPSNPQLLDIVEQVFGPDIALYNYRFVVKDQHSREAVFLHQDTPYHVGWPQKASMFVALSPMTEGNGPLRLYAGSHQFGYLGDAGEIARAWMGQPWEQVNMEPGDALLMHSACWHESGEQHFGPERILADIIYQPASDPSGRELLRGQWRCTPQPWLHSPHLFVRSRVSRIKDLEEQCRSK